MTEISITEFRKNIKYYSEQVLKTDLLVMNNGKPVMKVTNPNKYKIQLVDSLIGSVEPFDENEIMEGKLSQS